LIATRTFTSPDSASKQLRGSIGHGWHSASSPAMATENPR
jgi:hypothetical protein